MPQIPRQQRQAHAAPFPRHDLRSWRTAGAIFGWVALAVPACSHDWDAYDPRLGKGGSGGVGGTTTGGTNSGGVGGTTAGGMGGVGAGGNGGTTGTGGTAGSGGTGGCTPNIAEACYSGPPGTENVGPCIAGVKVCQPDGLTFGPCLDEVTPTVEECGLPGDENCDGLSNDHCALWAKQFGNGGEQQAVAIAVDFSGNVLVAGRMEGTMTLGATTLVSAGNYDAFVIKLSPLGEPLWGRVFGDSENQEALAVAVDPSGNVLVSGFYEGTIEFNKGGGPTYPNGGFEDAFVVKLDPNGNYLWSTVISGAFAQYGTAIAADNLGDVIVGGSFDGPTDFGGTIEPGVDNLDAFVWKLSPDGAPLWLKTFGDFGDDEVLALALNSTNHVFATGYFDEGVDFGAGNIVDGGGTDAFVVEIGATGSYVFGKGYPALGDQRATSVGLDPAGNVFLSGVADQEINFGGGTLSVAGLNDMFAIKLGPTGNQIWAKLYGDAANQQNAFLAVDSKGDAVLACSFEGAVDFGGGSFVTGTSGSSDIAIAKLSGATGSHVWSRRFGDALDQDARAITIGASDNILVTGEFGGLLHFGVTELDNLSSDDVFVAKLPP